MDKPIIFSIDDDPQVLNAIARDLKARYSNDYKVISTTSATEALEMVVELKNESRAIAMFICDQRMPKMTGVEFMVSAIKIYPDTKRILLTAYADTETAIIAINKAQLDYYLTKPWDPAEKELYPVVDDLLSDWECTYTLILKEYVLLDFNILPIPTV